MKSHFIFLVLLTVLFDSCVESIPLKIESTDTVVVNCVLHKSYTQTLTLTYSKSKDKSLYYEPVHEATIELYKNDTLIGLFEKNGNRKWVINHFPQFDSRYQLIISIPDRDEIQAFTTFPSESEIMYLKETTYKKGFSQTNQTNPQWIFVLNAELDERWDNPFEIPKINSSDRLVESIATNHSSADRFNQNGNLSDLIGDASSLPAYDFYIRINPYHELISFDIEANYLKNCFVVFRNSSNEYDQYMKTSFQKMQLYSDEDDPGAWFDENEIYNNIENGVGIFGAYNDEIFVFGNIEIP